MATLPASAPTSCRRIHLRRQTGRRRLVNPAAFSVPANGTWAISAVHRNGPGMSRDRQFAAEEIQVTERLALISAPGVYNLLNHPVYSSPSGKIGTLTGNPPSVSGSFGPSPASSTPALSERARPAVSIHVPGRVLANGRRQPPTRVRVERCPASRGRLPHRARAV